MAKYRHVTHLSRARVKTTVAFTTRMLAVEFRHPKGTFCFRILFPITPPCGIIPAHLSNLVLSYREGESREQSPLEFHRATRRISPIHFRGGNAERIHGPSSDSRRPVWTAVWGRHRIRGTSRGLDGLRFDSNFRFIHQHSSGFRALYDP